MNSSTRERQQGFILFLRLFRYELNRVAIGNQPSKDPMAGKGKTKSLLTSATAAWSVYVAVKRWMRVNAVVGCGRARYWSPGVSQTWQLGFLCTSRMTHQPQWKKVNPPDKLTYSCSCCRSAACLQMSLLIMTCRKRVQRITSLTLKDLKTLVTLCWNLHNSSQEFLVKLDAD